MIRTMIDDQGYPIFEIEYVATDYAVAGTVYEVNSWNIDKTINDKEKYLAFTIKWDSCSHLYFGDEEGYLHMCGVNSFQKHVLLLNTLYNLAFEAMGREPMEGENW